MEKESSVTSTMKPVSKYTPRPSYDDDEDEDGVVPLWPAGSEQKGLCAWPTFYNLWKNKFRHIKI